jgi:acetamidase/formamidase
LENDAYVMSTGSARPLEDAFRISHVDIVTWMATSFGFDSLDAYQLVTQVAESPIANVCDPNYTVVTKVQKQYLPRVAVYGGIHQHLREKASAYTAARG